MRENSALTAWRNNEQTIGCWLSVANAYTAEAIANLDFDWVCVDLQHGMIDYTDLRSMRRPFQPPTPHRWCGSPGMNLMK